MKEEALKLANEFDEMTDPFQSLVYAHKAQAMIRRLVEELDKQCKPINHYEPTAWINHIKQTGGDFYELNVSGRGEPLYRHPPQYRELSDEEKEKAKIRVLANPDVEQSHLTSNEIISQPVAWMIIDVDNGKSLQFKENKFSEINIPLYTAPKELSDEELNKAFDYYCETDEGVLRFNYELRDEWKKEQLSRWKESFKKAREK